MGKERKINGFNLRGVTSAKLSGSSVGIPGSISGNFPHTMTQKLKLRRYGTSWSLTSMRQMISASCTLQYKFYSENMATNFPRREVKVILKDGTDDCPFLPKRNTKTVIIYLHSFHHPISNLRDYRGPKKASAAAGWFKKVNISSQSVTKGVCNGRAVRFPIKKIRGMNSEIR
jgi:hypothetical protein